MADLDPFFACDSENSPIYTRVSQKTTSISDCLAELDSRYQPGNNIPWIFSRILENRILMEIDFLKCMDFHSKCIGKCLKNEKNDFLPFKPLSNNVNSFFYQISRVLNVWSIIFITVGNISAVPRGAKSLKMTKIWYFGSFWEPLRNLNIG